MVPLCEQLRAQHKRAVETSGVRLSAWAAFLQQSIPAIPGMLRSCSFECNGMPEAMPALRAAIRNRFVIRFNIAKFTLVKRSIGCQDQPRQPEICGRLMVTATLTSEPFKSFLENERYHTQTPSCRSPDADAQDRSLCVFDLS